MKSLRFLAFAAIFYAAHTAHAQSNLVLFISSPGDFLGQGQTYLTTNTSEFTCIGSASLVTVSAFGYGFNFSPGSAAGVLAVGGYPNASGYPFNTTGPGLDVGGNGRGCNTDCGSFQVLEFHTDGSGAVDRLWLVYTNQCECFMAPMMGEIRYHSVLAPPAPAPRTLHVPADYPTIQAALNAAQILTVDTVLVSSGTYNEAINFNGKPARLLSANGPLATIIVAPAGQNTVTFTSGETSNSVISGFTISNGSSGVYAAYGSLPTIISNSIVNNGTGVDTYFASPIVLDCAVLSNTSVGVFIVGGSSVIIQGNIIQYNGTGVGIDGGGAPLIANNFFRYNNGNAINCVNGGDANVVQNIIAYNSGSALSFLVPEGTRGPVAVNNTIVGNAAGISISGYDGASEIINNIIIGNAAVNVSYFYSPTVPLFQNNDIFSSTGNAYSGVITNLVGTNGNFSADPLFTCSPTGDYRLLPGSPAIDAGTNGAPGLTATDLLGNARIIAGTTNGSATVDLGAYEFNPAFPTTPCLYINPPSNIVAVAVAGQNSAVVNFPAPVGTPTATKAERVSVLTI